MSDVESISIARQDAQILFDAIVNTLDFGSGFLENDDVGALRRLAESLGLDPWTATPADFRRNYKHPYDPIKVGLRQGRCAYCLGSKPIDAHDD